MRGIKAVWLSGMRCNLSVAVRSLVMYSRSGPGHTVHVAVAWTLVNALNYLSMLVLLKGW